MMTVKQPEQTRKTILEAAFSQIYRKGFRSASLNQILDETGLTKGALYHHFPNKKALGLAIIDEMLEQSVKTHFLDPLKEWDNPVDGLKDIFGKAFSMLGEDEVMHGCPLNNLALEMSPVDESFQMRLKNIYQSWSDGFAQALRQGQERGFVNPRVEADDAASFLVASLAGCRSIAKSSRSVELMHSCKRGLVVFVESLRADTA